MNSLLGIRMKIIFLIFLFLMVNCAFKITQPEVFSESKPEPMLFRFYSTDLVLVKIICDSMKESNFGVCLLDSDLELNESKEKVKHIYLETQIKNVSSDYFTNVGKSLLTLTLGVFLTNSAKVDFIFYIEKNQQTLLDNTSISSEGKTGYWGVLPLYTGFIATNVGTLLNSYRKPDHLQRYCLYENPGEIRQVLETKKEEYCKDYELFLKDSFYKVQTKFFHIIKDSESVE